MGDVLASSGRDEETRAWPISKVEGVDIVFTEYHWRAENNFTSLNL